MACPCLLLGSTRSLATAAAAAGAAGPSFTTKGQCQGPGKRQTVAASRGRRACAAFVTGVSQGVRPDGAAEELGSKYDRPPRGRQGTTAPAKEERGEDVFAEAVLEFLEAARGVTKTLEVEVQEVCTVCQGRAGAWGEAEQACRLCRGSTEVSVWGGGHGGRRRMCCPACAGRGWSARVACGGCGGRGLRRVQRSVPLRVPPGLEGHSVLRLPGGGDVCSPGGTTGDLYVSVFVRQRPGLVRRGLDLLSEVHLRYVDAILGTRVAVATVQGPRSLPIPAGTPHGATLCLPGAGIAVPAKGTGSHYVRVLVDLPHPALCASGEVDLLRQLAGLQQQQQQQEKAESAEPCDQAVDL